MSTLQALGEGCDNPINVITLVTSLKPVDFNSL